MIKDRKGDYATRVCDECGDEKKNASYWNLKYKNVHLCYSCSNQKTNLGRVPYNKGMKMSPKNLGSTYISSDGYPMIWVGRHNYSHGYMPLHRFLVCEREGRILEKEEKVHHVNGDKLDYNDSNLYLCESMSHHRSVHAQLERISMELVKYGLIEFDHLNGIYKLSLPIKQLIESKFGEFMETPEKDNHELSFEELSKKVQRLFRKEVGPSGSEAPNSLIKDEDIVPSAK